MGRRRRMDEDALPDALAALTRARDRTLATIADSRSTVDLATIELNRARETLRELPGHSPADGVLPARNPVDGGEPSGAG
jgi:hypothetical protein